MTEKKLIPFNLERAKAGDPVQTRDGRDVRIICFDAKFKFESNKRLISLITENGYESIFTNTIEGRHYDDQIDTSLDLFMKPKTKTYWANVYRSDSETGIMVSKVHKCIEHAIDSQGYNYIKTISFDIEE